MMGSEDFLGPWTFALNNGSLQEESGVMARRVLPGGAGHVFHGTINGGEPARWWLGDDA
jgi:hypothetical protein